MDISNFTYLSKIREAQLNETLDSQVNASQKTTSLDLSRITDAEEWNLLKTADNTTKAAFASALQDEIEQIQERNELSLALSGASALGVTSNLSDLSEMMGSTSGRQAIMAMAESSLNSVLFDTTENEASYSVLDSMLTTESTAQQELATVLQNLLNVLSE